jgi:predicted nucleic acid-binding protein
MSVVVDANLIAALVLPLPYSDQATRKITAWNRAGVELLAPLLLEYEVAAILRKAVVAGWLGASGFALR